MPTVVIIPAYNEGPRIGAVVSAVVAAGYDVLVVDDGSKDDTSERAREAGAEVLTLSPNRGKGGAMRAGVEATDAEVVMFIDGDMKGFDRASLRAISDPVERGDYQQMIGVSREAKGITRKVLILSGQRALLREDLLALPSIAWDGYGIEVWLNDITPRRGGRTGLFTLDGVEATMKWEKDGAAVGLARMADMDAEIVWAMQKIVHHYETEATMRVAGTTDETIGYEDAPVPPTLEAKCASTECVADALSQSAARALWTPDVQDKFSRAVSREVSKPLWVGVGCVSYLLLGPFGPATTAAVWLLTTAPTTPSRRAAIGRGRY